MLTPELLKEDISEAVNVLKQGGIILYPTDTVWGIGCDATNPEAVKKIYSLKRRADSKAMLVLVDSRQMLADYVEKIPAPALQLLNDADGPTSIIYPQAKNLPDCLIAEDGSIGIRITGEAYSAGLCSMAGVPIVSTSANISGMPAAKHFCDIAPEIKDNVDYAAFYRRDDMTDAAPSALYKIDKDKVIKLR